MNTFFMMKVSLKLNIETDSKFNQIIFSGMKINRNRIL